MFCLMDVSGSMTEHMKDLAKRFYMLLHLFLKRRYKHVEIVFIRHTHEARGGGRGHLLPLHRDRRHGGLDRAGGDASHRDGARSSPADWNIYAAQASDGDNAPNDNDRTAALLTNAILPVCQYFAYLEVGRRGRAVLARPRHARRATCGAPMRRCGTTEPRFAMRKVRHRRDIFPVFRELFQQARRLRGRGHDVELDPAERLLFEGADWDFATLRRIYDAMRGDRASSELGLDIYPNQIEVITAEQMLDAYASIGMPLFYQHWSFGKHFAQHEALYRKGCSGLAYEIVINSNPCITYIMEENTATMQALVIAHAAFGHNHFFKNNYLFKQWTDADGILDYLDFAKGYIAECEERYGQAAVERAARRRACADEPRRASAIPRQRKPDLRTRGEARARAPRSTRSASSTTSGAPCRPRKRERAAERRARTRRRALLELPQENILYFLEKTAPRLQPWQREMLRIVRHDRAVFLSAAPDQGDERGLRHLRALPHHEPPARAGADQRRRTSWSSCTRTPTSCSSRASTIRRYNGINPYALGFAMMQRHRAHRDRARPPRTATGSPTSPATAIPMAVLRDVWANYRDESFIMQFLSPRADPRAGGCSTCSTTTGEPELRVDAIHDERGYRRIRRALARQYDVGLASTPTSRSWTSTSPATAG